MTERAGDRADGGVEEGLGDFGFAFDFPNAGVGEEGGVAGEGSEEGGAEKRARRDFTAQSACDGAAVLPSQADEQARGISRYARNDGRGGGEKAPACCVPFGSAQGRRNDGEAGKLPLSRTRMVKYMLLWG